MSTNENQPIEFAFVKDRVGPSKPYRINGFRVENYGVRKIVISLEYNNNDNNDALLRVALRSLLYYYRYIVCVRAHVRARAVKYPAWTCLSDAWMPKGTRRSRASVVNNNNN